MFNESKRSNNKLFRFVFSTLKVQTPPFMSITSVRGNEFQFIALPPTTGVPSGLGCLESVTKVHHTEIVLISSGKACKSCVDI